MAGDVNLQISQTAEIMEGMMKVLTNLIAQPSDAVLDSAEKQLTALRDSIKQAVFCGMDVSNIHTMLTDGLSDIAKNIQEEDEGNVVYAPATALALCPLDGRYSSIADDLCMYFSEYALVDYRVYVEVQWLIYLVFNLQCEITSNIQDKDDVALRIFSITDQFDGKDFTRVKEIESETNHDVKAVEYFVRECLSEMELDYLIPLVHIGCTSEDITNLAYGCMIDSFLKNYYIPLVSEFVEKLEEFAIETKDVAMLAHTHGQAATPTTFGKEMEVFAYRLKEQLKKLQGLEVKGKFNGATGNYAAMAVAFPDVCWPEESKSFVEEYLGLTFSPVTTQIECHDFVADLMDVVRHINNITIDFDSDMWMYISMFYCRLKVKKGEVGSSTMPHKVNPIKYENARGNAVISNALCTALSDTLVRSRLQRDLSDSTIQRNLGITFGYSVQALKEAMKGLASTMPNESRMAEELDNNWVVLGEAIQTVLRKNGDPKAYEKLKELTRGKEVDAEKMQEFILELDLPDKDKEWLLDLTPASYTGYAALLAEEYANQE